MAMSLNRAQIIGNLTRDPEVKQTPQGVSVASFGVATNFTWVDQSGVKQEKAEFHNVVVWRKLAEICGQYLKKGSKVFIEGKMQTRDWTGEDGVKRYRMEIVADNMIMLDRKGDSSSENFSRGNQFEQKKTQESAPREHRVIEEQGMQSQNNASVSSMPAEEEIKVDDLPF